MRNRLLLTPLFFTLPLLLCPLSESHADDPLPPGMVEPMSDQGKDRGADVHVRNVEPSLTQSFDVDGWRERTWADIGDSLRRSPTVGLDRTPPFGGFGVRLTKDEMNRQYYGLKFYQRLGARPSDHRVWPYFGILGGSASITVRSNSDITFVGVSFRKNSQRTFNRGTVGGLFGMNFRPSDRMFANLGTAFLDGDLAIDAAIKYAF